MKHSKASILVALASGGILALAVALFATNVANGNSGKWVAPASANSVKNPVAANPASIAQGRKIYGIECKQCHGTLGRGDGPKASDLSKTPGNLTTSEFQNQTDGAIFWKITHGNKPMPTFRTAYSDQDRWNLVNFIRTLGKR